jgi:Secretion system C-terminal sorting domain
MKRIFTLVLLVISFSLFSQGTIASWGFESITAATTASASLSLTAGSTLADAGVLTAGSAVSANHANGLSVYSTPAGNGTPKGLSSNNWQIGDYYQFQVATTGYKGIKVKWDQTGSSTGPAPFKLQYSTTAGGASGYLDFMNYTIPNSPGPTPAAGAQYPWSGTVPITATTFNMDLSALTALDGKSEVYFRLTCTATTAISASGTGALTGTNRIDNFIVTFNSVLPIELTSFNAIANNATTKLTWQTASEKNNSHFAIERSQNGETFSSLGEVKGSGNSVTAHDYSFTDATPYKGINYYRLRQVDFDGTESVSKTVSVNFDGKGRNKMKVYPTLVQDNLTVEVEGDAKSEITIRDLTGRVILTKNTEGPSAQVLNLGGFSNGLYLLSVRTNDGFETIKITKQ